MSEKENAKELVFHRADSLRQFQESADLQLRRVKEAEAIRAGSTLIDLLKKANCDCPEIVSQTIDLTNGEKGFDGKIAFVVRAFYSKDVRKIEVPVLFKEGSATFPEGSVLEDILSKADGVMAAESAKIRASLIEQYSAPEVVMTKTATTHPPVGSTFAHVLDVDKTWLPEDIKVGDLLFLDGAKYRVVSGDRRKMNSEADGSHWTLNLVHESADPKETVVHVI